MRVRFLVSLAGAYFSYDPGEEADLTGDELDKWLAAGFIEPVTRAGQIASAAESAALERSPETTAGAGALPRARGARAEKR